MRNLALVLILISAINSAYAKKETPVFVGEELGEIWTSAGYSMMGRFGSLGCRKTSETLPEGTDEATIPYAKIRAQIDKRGFVKKPKLEEVGNGLSDADAQAWIAFGKGNSFFPQFKATNGKKKGQKVNALITVYYLESDKCP